MRNNKTLGLLSCSCLFVFIRGLSCFPAPPPDPRDIVRHAFDLSEKTQQLSRNYTFLQRQHIRFLDGKGKVKRESTKTEDITLLDGSPYRRLVARDDKPLTPAEQKQEEDRLRLSNEQRRKETPAERERRLAQWRRRYDERTAPFREAADAFDFKLSGEETVDGTPVYVIDATPDPGYKPKSSAASILPKFKGRLWIAKSDYGIVKINAETLGTISYGGILFRLAKGTRLQLESEKVNGELWLWKRVAIQLSGRVLLVSGIHGDMEFSFSDYKKFQADARMVSTGEKP